jgi:hypothetical protein
VSRSALAAAVTVLALACASVPKPSADKAVVLGIPPNGKVELIIRSVDGVLTGELTRRPTHSVELTPGPHQLGLFCVVTDEKGNKSYGPTADLQLNVKPATTYTLGAEPGGKQCIVRVTVS